MRQNYCLFELILNIKTRNHKYMNQPDVNFLFYEKNIQNTKIYKL